MRIILTLVLISICLSVFSQDKLIVLHPIIGDTIDKQEQRDFVLFSDIIKQDFTFATIHCENEKYVMHINFTSGLKIVDIKEEDVVENSQHVDKLVKYFKTLDVKNDSLDIDLKTAENWPKFQSELLNDVQRRKLAEDARIYFRLNNDADRRGLLGVEKDNYIKVNSKSWLAETLFEILK